jgi:hypothetical protein
MKDRKALAEIAIDPETGWLLPTFGSGKPNRYWAHVHFENDPTWKQKVWTFNVDLDRAPEPKAGWVIATVYFMAENAPHDLIREGAKFELSCMDNLYTHGVITRIIETKE